MKYQKLILLIVFLFAFGARLYKLNTPLADWHSWRQADTASVSWRFLQGGIDLLHPRYHDLSNIPSGKDNPEGYRMVEFPLFNLFHVWSYRSLSGFSVGFETAGRLVSIILGLWGAYYFFRIIEKEISSKIAWLSVGFYLLLPFNIYYQRTILPENLLVASVLGFIWFFRQMIWSKTRLRQGIFGLASCSLLSLSLLVKPTAVFFILPAVVMSWKKYKLSMFKQVSLFIIFGISFFIFIGWRWWIGHFPSGIPAFTWLLNGNHIRFKPSFFRWIFGDRIGRLIMGYWGTLFLGLSLVNTRKKGIGFIFSWIGGGLLYLFIIATGNVQHDYYQIVIMPVIALMAGLGLNNFWQMNRKNGLIPAGMITAIMILFTWAFSWFFIRDYYNINHPEIVLAGQEADRLLPKDAKVITPYNGDTAFLYQTKRNGWPLGGEIEKKIKMGAEYYVSVNRDEETKNLAQHCVVLKETEQYVIINLNTCQVGKPSI